MDNGTKKRLAFFSFVPLLAYIACTLYFIYINRFLIHAGMADNHFRINGVMSAHYTTLTWLISISTLLAACVFFYDIVHLLRLRKMASWTKMGWVVFLAALGAFAFPFFWYLLIRNEPRNVALKPSID